MPEYDREGGSQRTFHVVEFLRENGWAVTLLAYNGSDSERYSRLLRQMGVAVYAGPDSRMVGDEYLPDPSAILKVGRFDLAILTFWTTAEYFIPLIRSLSPKTRIIVDSVDLHFLRRARTLFAERISGSPISDGLPRLSITNEMTSDARTEIIDAEDTLTGQYASEFAREINAYGKADTVLTVSQKEADILNDLVGDPELACAVPLMEDLTPSPLPFAQRKGILFIGNYRHPPNREAIRFLLSDVLPRIDRAVLHEHAVYLVGNGLEKVWTRSPHVHVVGWVPTLLPYLQSARLTVVPVKTGAGTKTKLIQSLTVGTPAVSTTVGIEGLDLQDERHVLVADDHGAFVAAIERLATDQAEWQRISLHGREHIIRVHGRDAVRSRFWSAVQKTRVRPTASSIRLSGAPRPVPQ